MRRMLLTLLIVVLKTLPAWAQYYEISEKELDTNYINVQLTELSNDPGAKDFEFRTEKIRYTAERLKYHKGVKTAINLLIGYYQKQENPDAELRTMLQYMNYTRINSLDEEEGAVQSEIGDIYLRYRLFDKAAESYDRALELAEKTNNVKERYLLLKKRGITNKELQKFGLAKDDIRNFLKIAEQKSEIKQEIWAMQVLSDIARLEKDYEEMVRLNQGILKITHANAFTKESIVALNNLGVAYKYNGSYKEAEEQFLRIINDTKTDPLVKAAAQQNIGIIYQNQKNYPLALKYFKEASLLYKKEKKFSEEALNLDFVSLIYYQTGDFYNALEYNKMCLNKTSLNHLPKVKEEAYYTRSLIHQGLYEFEDALEYYKKYLSLKDSLEMVEFREQQQILQQQFFLERQEGELELHYFGEEIKNMEIAKLKAEAQALIDRANAEADRLKAYQADSLFKQEQIVNQMYRIREIENMLKLKEKQELVRKRENEILLLDEQKRKKELELENERLIHERKQDEAARKLEREAAFNRNLTYILLGLLLMLIVIFFAYNQVRKKKKKIAEQNVIIEAERDKSEKLLLNILPVTVAQELKEKGQTKPRFYQEASVVFTDFAGFTKISERLTPEELVETLDKVFLEFDLITEKHGMSRIKTIGDAYMCVAGLPEHDPDHAANAVHAALEMRNFMQDFNGSLGKDQPQWNIRIGVNSGPLVAGVVGIRKFAYDIWGDAVNVASRMESSGEISKVNISENTYAKVKDIFKTEYRGKIYAKNKGDIDMYFVESER